MKKIELTPRLAAIVSEVPDGAKVADIGTDHGYLPIALIQAGRIDGAIATDVKPGPLSRGQEAAEMHGITTIDFRCCDGLHGISADETDTVVIAGMGGDTIIHILEAAPWTRAGTRLYLFQPMSALVELRQWLTGNGFLLIREIICREGEKFYVVFVVRPGEGRDYTLGELWAGTQCKGMQSPHRLAYLEDLIARRSRALEGLRKGKRDHIAAIAELEETVQQLAELREEWTTWQR